MKIETINIPELGGDIEIHLSKKDWLFYPKEIKLPDGITHTYQSPSDGSYEVLLKKIQVFKDSIINSYSGKEEMIFISFASSEFGRKKWEGDRYATDEGNLRYHGCAIGLDWCVVRKHKIREYKWKESVQTFNEKQRCFEYTPVYEWKEAVRYEHLRGGKYNHKQPRGIINSRSFFINNEPSHTLPYSKETEQFLKDTENAMEGMIEKVTAFFGVDEDMLIDNIAKGTKLLTQFGNTNQNQSS